MSSGTEQLSLKCFLQGVTRRDINTRSFILGWEETMNPAAGHLTPRPRFFFFFPFFSLIAPKAAPLFPRIYESAANPLERLHSEGKRTAVIFSERDRVISKLFSSNSVLGVFRF